MTADSDRGEVDRFRQSRYVHFNGKRPYFWTKSEGKRPTTDSTFSPTFHTSLSQPKTNHRVRFAPGPLEVASKYKTQDGHPDHEGLTAKQKRSLGRSFGADLTPQSVLALEKMLGKGDALYRPSLERLKRRVGLLPLRIRNHQYLTWTKRPQSRQQQEDKNGNNNSNNSKDDGGGHVRSKRPRLSLGDSTPQGEKHQLGDVAFPSVLDAATIKAVFEARRLLNIKLPATNNNNTGSDDTDSNSNSKTGRSLFLGRQQPALGTVAIGKMQSTSTIAAAAGSKRLGGLNDPFSSNIKHSKNRSIRSIKNHFSSESKKKT
jgi:hypothetical protein